jgi:transglutaminase-like putative cysteine protease
MATTTEANDTGTRRGLLVAALLFLGGATGAAFGRVFEGRQASIRLVAAGALAVVVAELMRRRHVLVSVAASAVGLVLVLTWFVFPDTTWWGLPTPDTVRALREALAVLGAEATREVAPAPPLPSLMAASLTAVWTAATAAHALAVRSRSTILPLLPPAALLAFAGVVTGDGPRPGYVTALLIGGMAVVFAVGVDRLGVWGRLVGSGSARRLVGSTTTRWAGWIGVTALFVALVLPGILPGYGARSVVLLKGGPGPVTISPIVDIRPTLRQNPVRELLVVKAARPAYWRTTVLDRFDGRLWTSSDLYAEQGSPIRGSQELYGLSRPGAPLTQSIEIKDLGGVWLPAAFEPRHISEIGLDETFRWDREAGVIVRPQGVDEGFRYQITSQVVDPTEGELRRAYEGFDVDDPSSALAPYRSLPGDLPPDIARIAQRVAGDGPTPYDQVLAIQEYLRSFQYDPTVKPGHGVSDILRFLEQTRRGYCEQFAGTMAVLVRALGYPARVAVGFLQGSRADDGTYHVTTRDAHAWPEVYFPGFGWLAFEPTPQRTNPAGAYLGTGGLTGPGGVGQRGRGRRGQDASAIQPREEFNATGTSSFQEAPAIAGPARQPRPVPWARLALALLATVAVVMAFSVVAKAVARRVALARRGPPRRAVRTAYRVFEASATDLGYGRRPSETLWEYRERLRDGRPFSDGHLERITSLADTAMYAARQMDDGQAAEAAAASRTLIRDLRRQAGMVRAALAALRPSPPV